MSDSKIDRASDPKLEFLFWLQKRSFESAAGYCKVMITLAGGALTVSLAGFLKNPDPAGTLARLDLLLYAWAFWAGTCTAIAGAFFVSHFAFKAATKTFENREGSGDLNLRSLWSRTSTVCCASSGILFICGLVFVVLFGLANLEAKKSEEGQSATRTPETRFFPNAHS